LIKSNGLPDISGFAKSNPSFFTGIYCHLIQGNIILISSLSNASGV